MATPPGGPSSYDSGPQQQPQDDQSAAAAGDAPFLNRFNFPSAPSESVQTSSPQPPAQPRPPHRTRPSQRLQQPQSPHSGQQQGQYPQGQPPQPPYGQQPQHDPQYQPHQPQHSRIQPVQPTHGEEPGTADDGDHYSPPQQPLVRPYAMTGGRTRPRYQLAIEALVHTTAEAAQLQGQLPEHQRICRLCYEIKSVAEISALLTIPLGVARILVADLAEAGLVAIHQPGGETTSADGQPDVTLLERVLSGLRKL
ncbi:DUF742 domain-containing protein [Streptomyces sp. NBC_01795]|uniref:DUF742 domain-containing protein n=1 Tax=Streptomyces sp. NBC_01795 TaxID=2975943 RepID=UPI002DDBFC82|nr:DUF742 domain-containing protein [Streptomyces sp. NBC_01795]WSA92144.1 DUF742 domain-containing protein [Streptomyces sp. NBC_01795]